MVFIRTIFEHLNVVMKYLFQEFTYFRYLNTMSRSTFLQGPTSCRVLSIESPAKFYCRLSVYQPHYLVMTRDLARYYSNPATRKDNCIREWPSVGALCAVRVKGEWQRGQVVGRERVRLVDCGETVTVSLKKVFNLVEKFKESSCIVILLSY